MSDSPESHPATGSEENVAETKTTSRRSPARKSPASKTAAKKAAAKKSAARKTASKQEAIEQQPDLPLEEPAAVAPDSPPVAEDIPIPAIKRVVRKVTRKPGFEENRSDTGEDGHGAEERGESGESNRRGRRNRRGPRNRRGGDREERDERDRRNEEDEGGGEEENLGPPQPCEGLLEIYPKGYGFLRARENNFDTTKNDVFVPLPMINEFGLRQGHMLGGISQMAKRGPLLTKLESLNGGPPDGYRGAPVFEELTATFPDRRIHLETSPDRLTTRVIDIFSPIGRGQRGLIVAPPRSGKTTVLQHIAEAIQENHEEEIHLMLLLVDERPEEVTELSRALPDAEVFASSNDSPPKKHLQMAEACIERAKRLVEGGQHVFILMDSITRLARAYNNATKGKGRTGSGGLDIRALEMPRKIFAAARNTREAGSLTIVATALVFTGSRMDEVIFQEFKGTGNMELVLDRRIAEKYIYPAADIFKSGTRKEELLLPAIQLPKIHFLRRGLSGMWPDQAMERLTQVMKRFPTNAQMLLEIKEPQS